MAKGLRGRTKTGQNLVSFLVYPPDQKPSQSVTIEESGKFRGRRINIFAMGCDRERNWPVKKCQGSALTGLSDGLALDNQSAGGL